MDKINLDKIRLDRVILNRPIADIKTLIYIILPQSKILIRIIIDQHNKDTFEGAFKGVLKSVLGINIKV